MTCPKRSQTAAHAYDTCEEHYGKDMNCDGFIGIDGDGDGYESEHTGGNDCDDYDATVHPGAVEIQGDNKDNNCNGRYNETISDDDGDGFANEDDCAPDDESIYPEPMKKLLKMVSIRTAMVGTSNRSRISRSTRAGDIACVALTNGPIGVIIISPVPLSGMLKPCLVRLSRWLSQMRNCRLCAH